MNRLQASLAIASMAGVLYLALLATAWNIGIRPVKAEDDCATSVQAVERLPIVGLVCIGE